MDPTRLMFILNRLNAREGTSDALISLVQMLHEVWHSSLSQDTSIEERLEAACAEFFLHSDVNRSEAWLLASMLFLGMLESPCDALNDVEDALTRRGDPRMN